MATMHMPGQVRSHRRKNGVLVLPLLVLFGLVFVALAYIAYVLWPRWPGPAIAADAPAYPITIAGITFNIPPGAIRVPVQRHPGTQQRIDLAFQWPSLEPPDAKPAAPPPTEQTIAARLPERIFVTLATADGTLPPAERMKVIYPRYTVSEPMRGPGGLLVLPFREGTPYQGEDLVYDAAAPQNFVMRCSRNGSGATPGTCLFERQIETVKFVVRFPRDWLSDWPQVAGHIDRLIKSFRPTRG